MIQSILNSATVSSNMSLKNALICAGMSLILGAVIALCYSIKERCTKSFLMTLMILPVMVQTIIMLVNGSLGAGIAIVGAFGLVRFRSIPGTSREISSIFFAMVVGVATGMGYITYAVLITILVGAVTIAINFLPLCAKSDRQQTLKITIFENLDFETVFDDVFDKYLKSVTLESVRTTNMGSMYQLQYNIEMKDRKQQKQFMDELRIRNGNLTIVCGRPIPQYNQL